MSQFNIFQLPDTILSGQSLSAGGQPNGLEIVGCVMPAGWDTATITFQGSMDGATWQNLYDETGGEVTLQAAAGRYIVVPPALMAGLPWVRVRSGTSGTPVNQTADRLLTWLIRNYGR
jgi:hypothetical protein